MQLQDLTGKHFLSGIETGQIEMPGYFDEVQMCNYVKFTLDGVHYMAVEDPEDGYRSCCRELQVSDVPPRNSFAPMEMHCTMKPGDDYEENNILVLTDAVTESVVLEIGTGNCADYYPYFHTYYNPESMACNQVQISDDEFERVLFS